MKLTYRNSQITYPVLVDVRLPFVLYGSTCVSHALFSRVNCLLDWYKTWSFSFALGLDQLRNDASYCSRRISHLFLVPDYFDDPPRIDICSVHFQPNFLVTFKQTTRPFLLNWKSGMRSTSHVFPAIIWNYFIIICNSVEYGRKKMKTCLSRFPKTSREQKRHLRWITSQPCAHEMSIVRLSIVALT